MQCECWRLGRPFVAARATHLHARLSQDAGHTARLSLSTAARRVTRRANGAALATAIAHGVTPKLWHRTPLGYAALLRPPPEHSGDRVGDCEPNRLRRWAVEVASSRRAPTTMAPFRNPARERRMGMVWGGRGLRGRPGRGNRGRGAAGRRTKGREQSGR